MKLNFSALTFLSLTAQAFSQAVPDLVTLLGNTPELSRLLTAVSTFPEMVTALAAAENITILAPNNDAFAAFAAMSQAQNVSREGLAALLSYHVINGSVPSTALSTTPALAPTYLGAFGEYPSFKNLTAGDSQVIKAVIEDDKPYVYGGLGMKVSVQTTDVRFTNGIVHIIDTVLPPPMSVSLTAKAANLTVLADALTASGLMSTVNEMNSITVFAPTDAAFDDISSTITTLTNEQIAEILTYHVVPSRAFSTDLEDGMKIETVNGKMVTISIEGDDVYVNGAKVILTDVITNNGVVHVINSVLNPNNTDDQPEPSSTNGSPAFPGPSSNTSATTSGAVATATGAAGKMGVSSMLIALTAGAFALGMMA